MSYQNLLNALCKWERQPVDENTENEFGEETGNPVVIEDNVDCRLEKLYDRELIEAFAGGDHDKAIYVLYLPIGKNIRSSDTVTMIETVKVKSFGDTNINGLYKRIDTITNDQPVYTLSGTDYEISFDGTNWIIKDTNTSSVRYKTSGATLKKATWVVVNGATPAGKAIVNSVPDFEYNTLNEPNILIVLDVEDAGGGHNHHLQCFCRYRKEIQ